MHFRHPVCWGVSPHSSLKPSISRGMTSIYTCSSFQNGSNIKFTICRITTANKGKSWSQSMNEWYLDISESNLRWISDYGVLDCDCKIYPEQMICKYPFISRIRIYLYAIVSHSKCQFNLMQEKTRRPWFDLQQTRYYKGEFIINSMT